MTLAVHSFEPFRSLLSSLRTDANIQTRTPGIRFRRET